MEKEMFKKELTFVFEKAPTGRFDCRMKYEEDSICGNLVGCSAVSYEDAFLSLIRNYSNLVNNKDQSFIFKSFFENSYKNIYNVENVMSELSSIKNSEEQQYDEKGTAKHYTADRIEDIVKMERVFGTQAAFNFCEITEFKYRMRMGKKQGQSLEQELKKANWYNKMAKILSDKIGTSNQILEPTQLKSGM